MKLSDIKISEQIAPDTESSPPGPSPDMPSVGDTIRTKKMQMTGKVEQLGKNRAGYDEVFFRVGDGNLMKTPLSNVVVVQPISDEDQDMVCELSTNKLAKYKTAAAADASAADKAGDTQRGNKRFSGIVKATKKQFANDAKNRQVSEGPDDNFTADDLKQLETIRDLPTLKAQAKILVKGKAARKMKPEKIEWFYNAIDQKTSQNSIIKLMYDLLLAGEGQGVIGTRNSMRPNSYRDRFGEGTMGGINRSAPSHDVSYEKMLDEIMQEESEMKINELSVGKMQDYVGKAKSIQGFQSGRPLRKIAKTAATGVPTAQDKINAKTGDRSGNRPKQGPIRQGPKSLEERLQEFLSVDEAFMNRWHGYVPGEKGNADPRLSPGGNPDKISPDAEAPDKKLTALAKAPKSAMQGKGNIRFSDLVIDSIQEHGLKWAFNEYVVKHGLPPAHFKIFAKKWLDGEVPRGRD